MNPLLMTRCTKYSGIFAAILEPGPIIATAVSPPGQTGQEVFHIIQRFVHLNLFKKVRVI